MSPQPNCKVCFIRVETNAQKQEKLCRLVHSLFTAKQKVVIMVPSDEAAAYVDKLLWKVPEESFLPHAIARGSSNERVAITTSQTDTFGADALVNLCPGCVGAQSGVTAVYELDDVTTQEKASHSAQKRAAYASAGCPIE
jgi:DNA polymerase IIIc chi subunit